MMEPILICKTIQRKITQASIQSFIFQTDPSSKECDLHKRRQETKMDKMSLFSLIFNNKKKDVKKVS